MASFLNQAMTRRSLLKGSAQGVPALVIAFHLSSKSSAQGGTAAAEFEPNALLTIDADGIATMVCDKAEIGQGISDGFVSVIAEELGADIEQVRLAEMPTDPSSWNGRMSVSGSRSMTSSWSSLRTAGAQARELLVKVAAGRLGVGEAECYTEAGKVIHRPTGSSVPFGDLVADAARLEPSASPALKDPAEFTVVGKRDVRVSVVQKVTGAAEYGIDAQVDGLLYGTIERAPTLGARPLEVDDRDALAIPGVVAVVAIAEDERAGVKPGVGVVATSYRAATRGRAALKIQWQSGDGATTNSDDIARELERMVAVPAESRDSHGDFETGYAEAATQLVAEYSVPYAHHMPMEPMNCTADIRADGATIWAPSQGQGGVQSTAAALTGLEPSSIEVITRFVGGGFGRRLRNDFVNEAVQLSMAVQAPVKLIWSREDDVRNGAYRPISHIRMEGGLDASGKMHAWRMTMASPDRFGPPECLYELPHLHIGAHRPVYPIPTGAWRSIHHSYNVFFSESFVDELAYAAGQDPVAFRLANLPADSLYYRVTKAAADAAGWGTPLPAGRARGIAVGEALASTYVAQVVEVSVENGKPRVHKVTCAIDCGIAVSPGSVRAQAEGSIIWGLTAALYSQIDVRDGAVVQSNFHDYPALRIGETPEIEIVILPSERDPGGMGEPGVPPLAPALTNALFALTGQRVRSLPIRLDLG